MLLGANFKSKIVWNRTLERIVGRLEWWKAPMLSKGGRLTFIKSTLMSTPNYLISLFPIPVLVANKIEAMFKNFLWNDGPDCHHYHLVDWKTICTLMANGGLGIRKLIYHNKALLAKWLWRFGMERDSLWRRVVVARFGEQSRWESKEVHVRHGCGIWKSILKVRKDFWNLIQFKLGSGSKIKFWKTPGWGTVL